MTFKISFVCILLAFLIITVNADKSTVSAVENGGPLNKIQDLKIINSKTDVKHANIKEVGNSDPHMEIEDMFDEEGDDEVEHDEEEEEDDEDEDDDNELEIADRQADNEDNDEEYEDANDVEENEVDDDENEEEADASVGRINVDTATAKTDVSEKTANIKASMKTGDNHEVKVQST